MVEAGECNVFANVGLKLDNGSVDFSPPLGFNGVIGVSESAHGCNMSNFSHFRYQLDDADSLDTGKIGVKLERVYVVVEVVSIRNVGSRKQPLHATEHLLVACHALFNATDGLAQQKIKL